MKLESAEKTWKELSVCIKVLNKSFSLSCVCVCFKANYMFIELICYFVLVCPSLMK
jgi:hypothetical protein